MLQNLAASLARGLAMASVWLHSRSIQHLQRVLQRAEKPERPRHQQQSMKQSRRLGGRRTASGSPKPGSRSCMRPNPTSRLSSAGDGGGAGAV